MGFRRKYSSAISQKITFSIIVLVFAAAVVMGSVMSIYSGRLFENNSYAQFKTIEQQAANGINNQIMVAMQQFMSLEIDRDFVAISKNREKENASAQFSEIAHLFEIYKANNANLIDSMFFYRYDDVVFSEFSYAYNTGVEELFINKVKNELMRPVWLFPGMEIRGLEIVKSEDYISLAKEVNDIYNKYGVLVFNLNKRALRDVFDTIDLEKDGFRMLLVDDEGRIVLENGEYPFEGFENEFKYEENTSKFLNDGSMFSRTKLEYGGFELVFIVSRQLIAKQKILVMNFYVYCIALSLLIIFAVAYYVSTKITKPLISFTKAIQNVGEGEYDIKFEYYHNDEIGSLVKAYNKMMKKTQRLIEKIKDEQELKSIYELNMLRQQIDAHFLYNSLDVIYWFSKNGEGDKAADVTIALSKILRISVSNGRDIITVNEEIMHLESYLTVQNYRFDFQYEIDVDPQILEYNIPKLILQPLAENAIVHGFEEIEYPARLLIRGFLNEDRVVFEVEDNGIGFDMETTIKLINDKTPVTDRNTRYALKNIRMRFNLIYGEGEYIRFITAPGQGTKVIISLPKL